VLNSATFHITIRCRQFYRMNKLEFYKDFYFFEEKRKNDLDGKVNLPLLIISAIFSIHLFIFSQPVFESFLLLLKIITGINILMICISIYFLQKSYSNLSNSYWYKEIAEINKFREYDLELNKVKKEGAEEFLVDVLERELADCASINRNVNIDRTRNLGRCKQFLFISILFTALLSGIYIINLLKITYHG